RRWNWTPTSMISIRPHWNGSSSSARSTASSIRDLCAAIVPALRDHRAGC
ncbi:MAG: hypothetical protein IPL99_29355, partial [Candidatus Competibacteraceae bacterium]|nr:hypothetical protein [Candidatus Competibacteraceae bacterium]